MRPDIINITQGRARIFPDSRYPGGGWFSFVPGITGNNYSFAEKAGYHWIHLYESATGSSDIFNTGNLKSKELFYFPHGEYSSAATSFGYQSESLVGNSYSGVSRRQLNPNSADYLSYNNEYCRIRVAQNSGSWSNPYLTGYVFDNKSSIGIKVYECKSSGIFGNGSQGISGVFVNFNNPNNRVTGIVSSFSGLFDAYAFESGLNNGLPIYTTGQLFFNSSTSLSSISGWTATTTGYDYDYSADGPKHWIKGEFLISADNYPTKSVKGIRSAYSADTYWNGFYTPTNSGASFPQTFNGDGDYLCNTGALIDSYSVPRCPYVEVILNERFSGESGFELYRATGNSSNPYLLYQVFDNATGSQTSGDYDYAETGNLYNSGINEFRGPLTSGHASFNSGNSHLSGIQSQWIYRDYDVYPGVPVYYKSRAYQTYPDGSKQYSQYAFHEIAEFPKIVPTGFCTPYLTVIDSDNPDNVFTAVCQFSDSVPVYGVTSDTYAPDWNYTAKILRRCQDVVAFSVGTGLNPSGNVTADTKSGRYQADGWAYLRFIHTGDFRSAYTEKFLPIKFMSGNSSNFAAELASQPDALSPNTEITNWPNRAGDPHDA